jgi:hypothetical protein
MQAGKEEGCLRTMDSAPAGMNPKHMEMSAVLLAAVSYGLMNRSDWSGKLTACSIMEFDRSQLGEVQR